MFHNKSYLYRNFISIPLHFGGNSWWPSMALNKQRTFIYIDRNASVILISKFKSWFWSTQSDSSSVIISWWEIFFWIIQFRSRTTFASCWRRTNEMSGIEILFSPIQFWECNLCDDIVSRICLHLLEILSNGATEWNKETRCSQLCKIQFILWTFETTFIDVSDEMFHYFIISIYMLSDTVKQVSPYYLLISTHVMYKLNMNIYICMYLKWIYISNNKISNESPIVLSTSHWSTVRFGVNFRLLEQRQRMRMNPGII